MELVKELYQIPHGNAQNGSVKHTNVESELFPILPYSQHEVGQS